MSQRLKTAANSERLASTFFKNLVAVSAWQGQRQDVWWLAGLVAWLMVMIATPIAGWVGGDETFPTMATLGVLTQFGLMMLTLGLAWPSKQLLQVSLVVMVGTWAAETFGSKTGLLFGNYHYTDLLQPQIAGVPVIIPLAWLMMLPAAWAVADILLTRHLPYRRLYFALLSGLALTAWDLYLDPQMVERNLWIWDQPGAYFGIPLVNFVGWVLVSSLLTLLIYPRNLPRQRLLIIYTLTWAFQAIGLGIFWGQPGPALVGFSVMGLFVGWAWSKELADG
jgi:putative membrane protein